MNIQNISDDYYELLEIIKSKNIQTVFQPIVSLTNGEIFGYEALSRGPAGSKFESPVKLFSAAKKKNLTWELELLCRIKALEKAQNNLKNKYLFLNVDPHIINDEKFRKGFTLDFLKQFNMDPQKIIFEITEKSAIEDYKRFRNVLSHYLNQGYKIAIDDTGSGYSGLRMLAETNPHFIKIDMELVKDIDKDYIKQSLFKTFQQFAVITNIKIIAEGIETAAELNTLIELGVGFGQGFFLQRPSNGFLSISPIAKDLILRLNEQKMRLFSSTPTSLPVGEIAKPETPIRPQTSGQEVNNIFRKNDLLQGIPIVDYNSKPVGLIMKYEFYANMASQYGVALFTKRPIKLIMDTKPLILDYYTPLDQVSRLSVARNEKNLYDIIIITKDDLYYGITTIKDLLINTTQMELKIAKYSNPLTGLPGNLIIEENLKNSINIDTPFSVIYVDLDNFKAYNDVYGFENGDNVLTVTASILSKNVARFDSFKGFLGHIGGDDFLIITHTKDITSFCESIINDFEIEKLNFYSENDKTKGFISSKNRKGEIENFPLLTVSLAVVDCSKTKYNNIINLSEKASLIKHICKMKKESCYYIS